MRIERLIYPVLTLGPGKRIGLWTIGCPRSCKGCINPELQTTHTTKNIEVTSLARILIEKSKEKSINGITISGGDPFMQKEELHLLLKLIRPYYSDILVYTGYFLEQIPQIFLENIDVLIDGPYREELNRKEAVLRGSLNQRIIYLNKEKEKEYEEILKKGREIQNYYLNSTLVSIGIHNRLE